MRNSVTFEIIFFPKSSKAKNGKAPLYARITLNGEQIEPSLQRRITHQQTRDVFIFSCYTGLSWIDAKNLKLKNIFNGIDGRKWIFTA